MTCRSSTHHSLLFSLNYVVVINNDAIPEAVYKRGVLFCEIYCNNFYFSVKIQFYAHYLFIFVMYFLKYIHWSKFPEIYLFIIGVFCRFSSFFTIVTSHVYFIIIILIRYYGWLTGIWRHSEVNIRFKMSWNMHNDISFHNKVHSWNRRKTW